jgi:hypothetical protein
VRRTEIRARVVGRWSSPRGGDGGGSKSHGGGGAPARGARQTGLRREGEGWECSSGRDLERGQKGVTVRWPVSLRDCCRR